MLFYCVLAILLGCWASRAHGGIRETSDAIIIEADYSSTRQGRLNPYARVPSNTFKMTEKTCWTPDGQMGRCGSVRSCYPHFKLPPLSNLETWVLGTRGTCHYVEPDGRNFYGLCCPIRGFEEKEEDVMPEKPNAVSSQINPADDASKQDARSRCGRGPFRVLTLDEQSRIVGGQEAPPNGWKFIGSMQASGRHFCGCSLISETIALTAAHCVAHFQSQDVAKLEIVFGLHRISDPSNAVKRKVRRITRHIDYNKPSPMFNDVALITLASPVQFNDNVGPVCLPNGGFDSSGQEAAVIGWGSTREGGTAASTLQQVTVKIIPNNECSSKYKPSNYVIANHMVCAALPGRDSCQGDSGGPFITQSGPGQPWHQVGIVSWGIGCAKTEYPGVYTRVNSFLKWIEKNSK